MTSRTIDLTGRIFGYLKVLERVENHISPSGSVLAVWLCECRCGNKIPVYATHLKNGNTKSCGCYHSEIVHNTVFKDFTGMRFGRLFVLSFDHKNKRNESYFLCECDCGNKLAIRSSGLMSGHSQSCGCLQKEIMKETIAGWNFKDITGKTFGCLTVVGWNSNDGKKTLWDCVCKCGNKSIVCTGDLQRGNTKSCGCQNESVIASQLKEYFIKNYSAKKELKLFQNPETKQWFKCDIYLPNENVFIEVHGEQHYQIGGFHKLQADRNETTPEYEFEYQQWKDQLKKKFSEENGTYIEVDLRKIKTTEQAIEYIENIIAQL